MASSFMSSNKSNTISISGWIGDQLIVQDYFICTKPRAGVWTGKSGYESALFVDVPVSVGPQASTGGSFLCNEELPSSTPQVSDAAFDFAEQILKDCDASARKRVKAQSEREERLQTKQAAIGGFSASTASSGAASRTSEQDRKVEQLDQTLKIGKDRCKFYLESCNWDIADATNLYLDGQNTGATAVPSTGPATVFLMLPDGRRVLETFKIDQVVFEIYQKAYLHLTDNTRSYTMALRDDRGNVTKELDELTFSSSLRDVGITSNGQHEVKVSYSR